MGSTATLTLIDPDLNVDSLTAETVNRDMTPETWDAGFVYVYSTSDSTGSGILMVETGANTGVFTGTFTLDTSTTQANSPTIQVTPGDTVTCLYRDAADASGAIQDVAVTAVVNMPL
jgi:hypothetical protein